jgi:hypothetical protein
MSIRKRTETKPIEQDIDLAPDPDDNRDLALERSLADSVSFDGLPLRSVSAGTIALLQRSGNKLFFGDTSNFLCDIAGFIILHSDPFFAAEARKAIYRNDGSFDEMVFEFLDQPGIQEKITAFSPTLKQMLDDYTSTQTVSLGGGTGDAPKKSGSRTG